MAEPISLRISERVRMDLRLSLLIYSTWSQHERCIRPLEVILLEAAKLWEISHRWWVREYYPDWVRTLLNSGRARAIKQTERIRPPGVTLGQHAIRIPFEFNHIHSEGKNLGARGNN